jgi:outer membrane protein OmpA-like peptidoglycan-associated protein
MKKIFLLLVAAGGAFSAIAQTPDANNNTDNSTQARLDSLNKHNYKKEAYLSRWVLDINLMAGVLSQDIRKANTDPNYTNGIDLQTGKLSFDKGMSYGAEAQVGYFFGKKAHFGVGVGFNYFYQTGNLNLDQFSVQYQSLDQNNNTFRQMISSTDGNVVQEKLVIQNMNIPLVFKYKTRFSKHFGFTADAGLLYNVQMQNAYTTNAAFDYEAVYQFTSDVPGNKVPVYDNSETPSKYDWLITKNQVGYHYGVSGAALTDSINSYHNQGYNVGLGVKPSKTTGTTNYSQGSIGFLVRPAVTYFFSDKVALMLGIYYMYQPEKNVPQSDYMLTNHTGDYTSVTRSVEKSIYQSYGGTLGVRFYLGKYKGEVPSLKVTSEDSTNPSICGVMDGTITLHQFNSGDSVTVDYIYNGVPQPTVHDTVTEYGTIRLTRLGAGSYTGITVTKDGMSAAGPAITLVNPSLGVYSQSSTDPTVANACDGTIRMHGLHPGVTLTVNYSMNGTPQKAVKGVTLGDGTMKLTGLCPGKYTNIVATNNTCSVNGLDVTLNNPPVPTPTTIKSERPDVTTPILFDFNMTTIHPVSYPVLMEAVIELNEDENANIVIDGYTDNVGKQGYNMKLSNKRADAVRTYLTNNGISAKRLKSVGHGLDNPVAPNDTPEGRAKNRRVTMTLRHNK